jgi:hypothetical protein
MCELQAQCASMTTRYCCLTHTCFWLSSRKASFPPPAKARPHGSATRAERPPGGLKAASIKTWVAVQ